MRACVRACVRVCDRGEGGWVDKCHYKLFAGKECSKIIELHIVFYVAIK